MQPWLLPLFPLNVVLFPDTSLPLHIFEERYKEMFGEVLRDNSEFGVVLATEKGIAHAGCTAKVEQVIQKYPDGRMDLLCLGKRRFEINLLNEERPFLRGDIHFFDDEEKEPAPQEIREKLVKIVESFAGLDESLNVQNPRLSFAIGQRISDLELRQALLGMRSEADRIEYLADVIPGWAERLKLVEHVRHVAPRNGHGSHLKKDT